MRLPQSCPCGARFEVEEKSPSSAGQTVHCPQCQRPVRAGRPAEVWGLSRAAQHGGNRLKSVPRLRTSGFALASVILGVMLTFTVVGTVLAVILGLVALVHIARHRDHV